jgi:hypothetical protein
MDNDNQNRTEELSAKVNRLKHVRFLLNISLSIGNFNFKIFVDQVNYRNGQRRQKPKHVPGINGD